MILDAAVVVAGVLLGGQFGACTVVTIVISAPIIQLAHQKQNSCAGLGEVLLKLTLKANLHTIIVMKSAR